MERNVRWLQAVGASVVLLTLVQGCYTFDDKRTEWKSDSVSLADYGPGPRQRITRVKYESKSGKNMTIGFMPGASRACGEGDAQGNKVNPFVFGGTALLSNCCMLLFPTFETLFCEPFIKIHSDRSKDYAESGLLGVYRWTSKASVKKVKVDYDENVVVEGDGDPSAMKLKMPDGSHVWGSFPGFDKLYADVKKHESVGVIFDDGSHIRRFTLSENQAMALSCTDEKIVGSMPEVVLAAARYRKVCHGLAELRAELKGYEKAAECKSMIVEIDELTKKINRGMEEPEAKVADLLEPHLRELSERADAAIELIDGRRDRAQLDKVKKAERRQLMEEIKEEWLAKERLKECCGLKVGATPEELGVKKVTPGAAGMYYGEIRLRDPFAGCEVAEVGFTRRSRKLAMIKLTRPFKGSDPIGYRQRVFLQVCDALDDTYGCSLGERAEKALGADKHAFRDGFGFILTDGSFATMRVSYYANLQSARVEVTFCRDDLVAKER